MEYLEKKEVWIFEGEEFDNCTDILIYLRNKGWDEEDAMKYLYACLNCPF